MRWWFALEGIEQHERVAGQQLPSCVDWCRSGENGGGSGASARRRGVWRQRGRRRHDQKKKKEYLHAVTTPDFVQEDPPPGPGLCGPVLWLIFLSIWPHILEGISERNFSGCL